MNPEAQEELDRILKLSLKELTPQDRAFLAARRGFLNDRQTGDFQSVLDQQDKLAEEKLAREAEENKPAQKEEVEKEKPVEAPLYVAKKDRVEETK